MPKKQVSNADLLRMIRTKEIALPQQPAEQPRKVLHVAVQGCCHGELDKIYDGIRDHEKTTGKRVDLLLCCGDFQCTRDVSDLSSMAVPDKYKTLGDFPAYHRGEKKAACLTLFIGGNHEASNVLANEYYGGYVAPDIYYLGHAGIVRVAGLRIAGLSGIYKGRDAFSSYPIPPYDSSTVRSAYHVRQFELDKLREAAAGGGSPIDIMMSHDWPAGITKYGDEAQLLRFKPYFADDIRAGALGHPRTLDLLRTIRPRYWFSAHLHCRFTAEVFHQNQPAGPTSDTPCLSMRSEVVQKDYEGFAGESDGTDAACDVAGMTEFLALDKCVKGRSFLEFRDLGIPEAAQLSDPPQRSKSGALVPMPDAAWLEVVRATHAQVPWAGTGVHYRSGALARVSPSTPSVTADVLSTPLDQTGLLLARLGLGSLRPLRGQPSPLPIPRTIPSPHLSSTPIAPPAVAATPEGDGMDWVEDVG